jgi:integrase
LRKATGRWAGQIYVTLANGESKRICVTGKTRDVVKRKLQDVIDRDNKGLPYDDKDWTIAAYLDYWMREVQVNRIRATTVTTYNVMINKHIKPVLGKHKLRNLCVSDVRRALNQLKARNCPERTLLECVRVLSASLNCAMREELIFRNVVQLVEKPRYKSRETVIWTAEQAAFFLRYTKDHPQHIAFLLFLTYGLRRGEALGLRYSDIDFSNNLIHIRQQIDRINGEVKARELKTANSRRNLPLIPHIRTALLEHAARNGVTMPSFDPCTRLSTYDTVVVGKTGIPLESKSLERSFHILARKAGLPRITIHAMRHTAATVLKDLSIPVKDAQLILGHANIATTLSIYQHGTPETHRVAITAVGERLLAY